MHTRRDFLHSTLIALAPTVPGFLARTARAAAPEQDGRVLVVIQLDGGNDGINTVVPYADEGYARSRKLLRLDTKSLIKIDRCVALHPAMRDAEKLLQSGRLAIVQGVGYPNPSRSHFQSMAVWHTARLDAEEHAGSGWLGRGLDAIPGSSGLFVGMGPAPAALRTRRAAVAALARFQDFVLDDATGVTRDGQSGLSEDDLASFVRRSTLAAYRSADRFAELSRRTDASARYPCTGLGDRLRTVARLLKVGYAARVFYTTQPGYDTHAGQLPTHSDLLAELSGALLAFEDDLAGSGLAERVLVLAFSEFGRRVAENGSAGTDHGTAGPVFLAGPRVRPGLAAPYPSLTDLVDGDLKFTVDFRQVYAAILADWLRLPPQSIVGGQFANLRRNRPVR